MSYRTHLLLDEPVLVVQRSLVRVLGGHDLALFLQQVHYRSTVDCPDGGDCWAVMSNEEWMEEVVLSKRQLERVLRTLGRMGVLESRSGPGSWDQTRWRRVDHDRLNKLFEAQQSAERDPKVEEAPDQPVEAASEIAEARDGSEMAADLHHHQTVVMGSTPSPPNGGVASPPNGGVRSPPNGGAVPLLKKEEIEDPPSTPPDDDGDDDSVPPPAGAAPPPSEQLKMDVGDEGDEPVTERAPDLFGAVAKACNYDTASMPGRSRAYVGKNAKALRELGATEADVERVAAAMAREWGSAKVTPGSLVTHWPRFSQPAATNGHSPQAHPAGVHYEPFAVLDEPLDVIQARSQAEFAEYEERLANTPGTSHWDERQRERRQREREQEAL